LRASLEFVTISIVRTYGCILLAIVLAHVCLGCAAGAVGAVSTIAPMVAAGSAQVVSSGAILKEGGGDTGATSKDDNADKCDQLLRVPPGVEEVRKDKGGEIESRQWKVINTVGSPTWIVIHEKDGPEDAWRPKPGIVTLLFDPPLDDMLKTDEPQYLAYAPADVVNISDSEQFDSMTGAFGAGVGTFKWHNRPYTYVLVKQLPCFKPAKEK
jgi:hypothetical protein